MLPDYEYLILGGGLQGTHASLALTVAAAVPRERVAVLDPYDEPLARWNCTTRNTGMTWLRSSVVQNIDLAPLSIKRFAATQPELAHSFYGRYNRPGLELFQQHAHHVLEKYRLAELRLRGRASAVHRSNGSLMVETDSGGISARNVVLALGNTENLYEPPWASAMRSEGARIEHIFSPDFNSANLPAGLDYAIIGGASSAIQLALHLAQRMAGKVTVLSLHPTSVAEFDYDAPWHGPRGRRELDAESDPGRRRAIIDRAKFSCTIPGDLDIELSQALEQGRLRLLVGRIEPRGADGQGRLQLVSVPAAGEEQEVSADITILATGFRSGCPQPEFIEALAEEHGGRIAPCGFPVPAPDLSWGSGIYLMGPHAELEIGPISRNLGGARRAAERLVENARQG